MSQSNKSFQLLLAISFCLAVVLSAAGVDGDNREDAGHSKLHLQETITARSPGTAQKASVESIALWSEVLVERGPVVQVNRGRLSV